MTQLLSTPFFEVLKDDRCIKLLPQALDLLKNTNGRIKVVTWLSPKLKSDNERVFLRVYPSSQEIICVLDISNLWDSLLSIDDSIEAVLLTYCLLLSSSFIVVCPPVDMKITLEKFGFIRGIVNSFDGDMSLLHSSLDKMPALLLLSFVDNPNTVSSNQILESLTKQENGFSTDVAMRNQLRDMIQELFPNQEGIGIPFASADLFMNDFSEILQHEDIRNRLYSAKDPDIQGLVLTASLFSKLTASTAGTVTSYRNLSFSVIKTSLVEPYLQECFDQAVCEYEGSIEKGETSNSSDGAAVAVAVAEQEYITNILDRVRQTHNTSILRAMNYWQGLFQPGGAVERDIGFKYKEKLLLLLDSRLESRILALEKESLGRCEAIAAELAEALALPSMHPEGRTPELHPDHVLGQGSNSQYNHLLALSSQIESFSSKYHSRTATRELESCSAKVLCKYLTKNVQVLLGKAQDWVLAFQSRSDETKERIRSSEGEIVQLKDNLVEVEAKAAHEVGVGEESISRLRSSLEQLRRTHATVNEAGSSNLEGLMDRLDRAARLNEQEKNELAQGLMAMQHRILKAQDRALELRQQREKSTATLHRDLIDGERSSHDRYKADITRQHELLEEELALERRIALKSTEFSNEMYAIESHHRSELETSQATIHQTLRQLRDVAMEDREARELAHERHLVQKRSELMAVESQLVLMVDAYVRTAEKKPCKVM